MKKILFLFITSMLVIGCSLSGEEPLGPNNSGSNNSVVTDKNNSSENSKDSGSSNSSNSSTSKPVQSKPEIPKYAKLYFKNNSNINRYKCYVNNIAETTVPTKSTSKAFEYYSGTYQIVIEQVDNVYENYRVKYSGNYNLTAGQTQTISFPNLATLTLKSNSSDDYNISINDGMLEYVCLTGHSIEIKNLDCATYKVKFTQRNGYHFYPTVETVYITLPENGKTYMFKP